MKHAALSILLFCGSLQAEMGFDKVEHVAVSAGLNTAFYTLFTGGLGRGTDIRVPCLVASSALTLLVGFTTEVNDSVTTRSPTLDGGDFAADVVGVAASSLAIWLLDIKGQDKVQLGFKENRLTIGWRF